MVPRFQTSKSHHRMEAKDLTSTRPRSMADEPDDDELEAYLRSSLSERRRSRWGRQSLRRGSSPFLTEGMAGKHGRRLSSFTTSSG
ncbi:hypothetical protein AVEN_112179-1, partial [Araneus ventricosus]